MMIYYLSHFSGKELVIINIIHISFSTELVLQVILTNLVYERQKKLRIMMKMHGLGDLPYWTISYCYFLLLSLLYVLSFMLFGSVLGTINYS